jgi:serine/threonine-protein kinase
MELEERLKAALADRYQIERQIGSGGMATVYLAQDLKHDRKVAVKILKPELAAVVGAERFLAEIKTTANLQHPNILPLFDSGEVDGQLFFVMPYVEGDSLRDRLDREKQLPIDEAVRIAGGIAEALQAAHDDGVIHRDIKPANILLRKGTPLVADFGVALAVSAAGGGRLTETGLSLGTPYYMSPEQASADRDPDARSDVYSLGAMLYEMLTGEPPYPGGTAQAVLAKILTEEPPAPTRHRHSIPPNVEGAILKAMEKLPADRFPSARAFADALKDPSFRHAAGVGPGSRRTLGPTANAWIGRLGWGAAAVLAIPLIITLTKGSEVRDGASEAFRYQILLPDSLPLTFHGPAHLGLWQNSLALSRDGRRLAYVAYHGGTTHLLIRDQETGSIGELEGTDGAYSPFFSPDGESVAFFTGSELRRVPASGGQTVPLGEYFEPAGGVWMEDGQILVADAEGDNPTLVPAAGGEPSPVGLERLSLRSPCLLPGEEWAAGVLYSDQLGVLSLATGELLAITRGGLVHPDSVRPRDMLIGFDPQYVETGHLIYLSNGDGGLMALPFDGQRRLVLGEPAPVLEGVRKEETYGFGHYAVAENGTLVYAPGLNAHRGHLVLLDGSEEVDTLLEFPRGQYDWLALSPDGRELLTGQRGEEGGKWEIWRWNLQTGLGRSVLANDTLSVMPYAWLDENRILAARSRPATQEWLSPAEASISEQTLQPISEELVSWPALHPDGSLYAAFVRGSRTLRIFSRDGSNQQERAVSGGDAASFSPDGRWLAFRSQGDVMVTPFPSAEEFHLVARPPAEMPQWSRSGDALFYRGPGEFWRVPFSELGGEPLLGEPELFASGPFVRVWAWSYAVLPDDRLLAVMGPPERSTGHLEVVTDFFSVLQERAPTRR